MKSDYLSLIDMVLLGDSRTPSTMGALISPAANIAHGFLEYFSCGCSEGSCCFQDAGAAVWAAAFPAAAPLCSEVGAPNSAAGKERSYVSTYSSRQTFFQLLTPPTTSPTLGSSIPGHAAGYPIHWDLCKSVARYILWENQTSQWVPLHSKSFCDNWSFPVCKTQEVSFNYILQNVSTPPKQYFHISNVPHLQAKTTIITYTLSFYVNVERERKSHAV